MNLRRRVSFVRSYPFTVLAMAVVLLPLPSAGAEAGAKAGALAPVPFTEVRFRDAFWLPRIETNRTVTIPHDFKMCEQTGRVSNFEVAGGLKRGKFQGIWYDDSDVYKVIEGASYSLATHPDPELDKYLDGLIAKIAAAQRPDGYLYTYHTINGLDQRYSNLKDGHELYCAGHLIEAAVAHHRATGKRSLLDVATKLADHIGTVFGPGLRHDVDGHEEIELALFKLADLTGEDKHAKLAEFFLRERGHDDCGRPLYGPYYQDFKPVHELNEVVGHAVRMVYLLSGMTDLAARTGDAEYRAAADRLFENLVVRKMYVTGGIGARHEGEAFGDEWELPNETAYAETCAAIGNALWNHRMNLLHGDAKYADVVERVLYNGFLSGVSLNGDRFFYVNPLASRGGHHRQAWYGTACCPVNVVRFLPSLPGYTYATGPGNGLYVNLYAASDSTVTLPSGNRVKVRQETNYPWDGAIKLTLDPQRPGPFPVYLRVPSWCDKESVTFKVNGERIADVVVSEKGYLPVHVVWKSGDTIELNLPMPVRRVKADPRVAANAGRVALQRGPVVYCVEAADHQGYVMDLYAARDLELKHEFRPDLLGGVVVLTGEAAVRTNDAGAGDGTGTARKPLLAVPYYAWDHRDAGEMAVWLPETPDLAVPRPAPTIANTSKASASHVWGNDTVRALADGAEPTSSSDRGIPRFTWWDHRGTTEWVQYDFAGGPRKVSTAAVYWFDDEPAGGRCRVPQSWTLLYRDAAGGWKPVANATEHGTEKDAFNAVKFDPVETTALRLEARLRPDFSGGILEWRVGE